MKPVIVLPIFFAILFVLLGNYYLFSGTIKSINQYKDNPPFRIEDATGSGGIHLLLDKDKNTVWRKKQEGNEDFDFFLEMKLSHFWNGKEFSPREFQNLKVFACPGENLPTFQMRFLLRESINVDKELRMPKDQLAFVYIFKEKNKSNLAIPLSNLPKFQKENNYPENIHILTPEFKLLSKDGCISEVELEETK
ncbi:hypothetical protein ND861_12595 [Leptospira sp. 2 VSF19]|uniref:Uncharacterized protein n=1 Tax=Leptospira soteropolitanensis TaxID=2950025 RepID=A0AAW5VR30_9LEPT|nr:hypothetical protein [Leptospira soteropolitanensis]MCW7493479.1 hypothetical protein [Leptospira soteropolitanensis]MCW7500989.1 hypothetical protein [Leptospira soteropolitanensis]MCW7523331.1 hypothetical protein [Leptospira soteropolitanensis]MCW7527192.1 hypothetical protein [Leptospira soteropolitanensis]MCW7531049.1 hypothetical protein [Leptospira soteropolitanensis]